MEGTGKPNPALTRKMKKIMIGIWVLLGISAGLGVFVYLKTLPPPFGTYDTFAKCIASTTTKFYGAWWCPHCHNQKNAFGDAAQYLPYTECSASDSSELPMCVDLGIKNFPTWVFPDSSTLTGEVPLATLSQKTGCPLPTSTSG